jgi:CRP/FNR family transcriptional regulator, cyclic AMP receptor protein
MARALRTQSTSITVDELLTHSAWYQPLDVDTQQTLRAAIVERTIPTGGFLGHHGETQRFWYGIMEGLLKWSINAPDGRTVTLGGQSVGSWFGEGTLLRGETRKADLMALRHSRVAMIPHETFNWLRLTETSFNDFLLNQINERLHWFMGTLAAHRLLDTHRIVAHTLAGLVHPLQNPRGEQYLVISQEELANLASISRQRCNEALTSMKDAGLVKIEYGALQILNLAALKKLAE